jgi:uncharacterized coiled-coil DUF342 family protein
MSHAETAFLGLGGTTKNVAELYSEIKDLRKEEDALFNDIMALRERALNDGDEAFYGIRGKKLVKKLTEMGARTANRVGKFRKAYETEVAKYAKEVDEEQTAVYKSPKSIRKSNKKAPPIKTKQEFTEEEEDDANVAATMAMVKSMLKLK